MTEGDPSDDAAAGGRWTRRLSILLIVSALTLVGLELLVGRFLPVLGQVYALDDELLHDARPGARRIQPMHPSRLRQGDVARVLVDIGDDGFRGPRLDRPKSRPRVLVLGDSFVMAENVVRERTFVERLGLALERGGDAGLRVETVNAGRSGYGPDQSLLLFQRCVDEVDPDAVVFVVCAHNDLGDLARNKLFRLSDVGALEGLRPRIGARMRDEFDRRSRRAGGLALERLWRFWRESGDRRPVDTVPAGTIDLYLAALSSQFAEHFVHGDDEVVSLFEDVYDADVAITPDAEAVGAKLALFQRIVEATQTLADDRGVPLHFVVVPSAVDACPGFGIGVDPDRYPTYSPDRIVTSLMGAIQRVGAVASDLTETLRTDDARYWVGGTDIHWNAGGQAEAAEVVAAALRRRPDVQAALEGP